KSLKTQDKVSLNFRRALDIAFFEVCVFLSRGIHGQNLRIEISLDTVPSSEQLESEEARDRRRTADRSNHDIFLDNGINSERS
ncbi:hypothetical protein HAX54_049302, partial [Datura stramonium]|nr:hypothetical protein [Datura stramonium]